MSLNLVRQIDGPIIVIGDIHGHVNLLRSMIHKLRSGVADFDERWIVFVGDFHDRGDASKEVLDCVLELMSAHPKTTSVMGNHEFALAGALGLTSVPESSNWDKRYLTSYDAAPTFRSYGVEVGDLASLKNAMPSAHLELLGGLPWVVEHPEYLIIHAGLMQNQSCEQQLIALRKKDYTDNRPAWLCSRGLALDGVPTDCSKTIVSGHVKVNEVTHLDRKILIDTSGGSGDNLSAILLPEKKVVQVHKKELS